MARMSKPYRNVFEALEDDAGVARNLQLRAELMAEIERLVERSGKTQTAAARWLGITQPRLSDLRRGRIERFSLDALVQILCAAGADVTVKVKRRAA
jgi:predicted XRE-type DNA-binding protein